MLRSLVGSEMCIRDILAPIANSAMMYSCTLTVHCRWEDETARERTDYPPSHADGQKMKSLTLHAHYCLRDSLRDYSSLLLSQSIRRQASVPEGFIHPSLT